MKTKNSIFRLNSIPKNFVFRFIERTLNKIGNIISDFLLS